MLSDGEMEQALFEVPWKGVGTAGTAKCASSRGTAGPSRASQQPRETILEKCSNKEDDRTSLACVGYIWRLGFPVVRQRQAMVSLTGGASLVRGMRL
jgi:hypothetical protein